MTKYLMLRTAFLYETHMTFNQTGIAVEIDILIMKTNKL